MIFKGWTKKEVLFLKNNYINLTYNQLAYHLKRNKKSVEWKLNHLNLRKSDKISLSNILKNYYKNHKHHMLGIPKSLNQRRKMGTARKEWLNKVSPEILEKINKKISYTKRVNGLSLGENNPMYGKKRLDLAERNKQSWKDPIFTRKMRTLLAQTTYKGSKKQKDLFYYLKRQFKNKIYYNDWKTLKYKYELDISIPSKQIAIEWDGYNWHYKNKENEIRDQLKNKLILAKGWKFIRIKDDHLNKADIKRIYNDVNILIKNINAPELKYTGGFYIE